MLKVTRAKKLNKESCESEGIDTRGLFQMNERELLHQKFFLEERTAVAELDDIALSARREEMAMIAFQARSCVAADDEAIKERKRKNGSNSRFGLNDDPNLGADLASDAINTIKTRQARLTKMDKLLGNLIKMGVPEDEARAVLSSRNIRDNSPSRIDQTTPVNTSSFNPFPNKTPEVRTKPGEINWDKVIAQATEEKKPIDFTGLNFKK